MTNLRCHFDSDGWLQGPINITHLFTPNHGTGFGTGRGVVLHTEQGFEAGTVATFMNGANEVSAFFSIAQDGSCHQYLPVGKGYTAFSQADGNEAWRGIEDEDGTHPSVPLTPAQITTFAQILEACSAFDGFPLKITDDVHGQGLILHSDGGQAWGGHLQCPGPVRAAQRPQIVALAMSIRQGTAPATDWQEALMNKLPVLQQGATDKPGNVFWVHRMKALLAMLGQVKSIPSAACLPVNGEFDAATAAGLKAVQASFGITADGICGPASWSVLLTGSAH